MQHSSTKKLLSVIFCASTLTVIFSLDSIASIARFCRNEWDIFLLKQGYVSFQQPVFLSVSQPLGTIKSLDEREGSPRLKEVLTKLAEISPEKDPFAGAKRCALVGNSSQLMGSGLGKAIDSFDTVVRFNEAPTIGYESDVGSKTSIRWTNSRRMPPPAEQKVGISLITTVFFPTDLSLIEGRILRDEYSQFTTVRILSPELTSWVTGLVGYGPSSGIIATLAAVIKCEEVSVFGLGPGRDGLWSHYFPKETPLPSYHSIENEQRLLNILKKGKLIELY
jgi:beta-galactoside alpha-2,3-sialyltransferase (sialyltransferase 4B)